MEFRLKKSFLKLFAGIITILIIVIAFLIFNPLARKENNMSLPDSLKMGAVELNVENLEKLVSYYKDIVGFELIELTEDTAEFGYNDQVFLRLKEIEGVYPEQGSAGLYHTAFLFKERAHLANALESVLTKAPDTYSGSADHLVSEAFYFYDPEGNGIELYYDKPREQWQWEDDGQIKMDSIYIDVNDYMNKYKSEEKSELGVGHVHLKVGNISEARRFYADIIDFEVTSDKAATALFVAAGGYHHHLGMNVWESSGAGKRKENEYGLANYEINLGDKTALNQLIKRLENNNIVFEKIDDNSILVFDPWNNKIIIKI